MLLLSGIASWTTTWKWPEALQVRRRGSADDPGCRSAHDQQHIDHAMVLIGIQHMMPNLESASCISRTGGGTASFSWKMSVEYLASVGVIVTFVNTAHMERATSKFGRILCFDLTRFLFISHSWKVRTPLPYSNGHGRVPVSAPRRWQWKTIPKK